MKGKQAMTPTERTRKRRERLEADGGRIIQVALSPTAAQHLDALVDAQGTITQAVEYALHCALRE